MSQRNNTIFFSLFMVFALISGILFLNRAIVNKADLNVIEGKVLFKKRKYSQAIKSGKFYYLEFELENTVEKLAIGFNSESQAINDSTYYKIDIGKNYKFYIDKSYPDSKGTNYGIDYIENNNKIIFIKDHTNELYFSIALIMVSLGFIVYAIRKLMKNEWAKDNE